ncbi:MAG: hypothetical protein UR69_C0002G0132 [Candidatus Moranbacteria bacterium GW2011_GWE2_35_2-]|nr:MAG: hypothetical protein UR69_C0002G0132 [Candidatus Moranbacteria bacterium GW2011_GWE2_35_2-]KKQ22518.1 MAG: hypothetical protein US37_C0002G0143 [Candidatus Moranbacteria bacterium GW2011_GWF2_37_11]KKQ29587.1 MAG: hypothetical protein US44_C0001G0179 [Candidatus Moranbacteria bacterium GW2011_GWD1_37_17]KKQ30542.1 MAG: hypothetical protein US47_C0002G0132 [Candidatus Moranbacteria bacterium GW2011_GWE1_37_24]
MFRNNYANYSIFNVRPLFNSKVNNKHLFCLLKILYFQAKINHSIKTPFGQYRFSNKKEIKKNLFFMRGRPDSNRRPIA